ncbi:MAG: 50S ribosomal protein L9 [Defluviitaleaceae bacterium]|nr:50S ribosomal protein L9 [Defluviitaleaceae bacterium]
MKVILLGDVKNIGKKDEIINASDGYVKNFLFPKNLAVEANHQNLQKLKAKQTKIKEEEQKLLDEAKEIYEKIKDIVVVINAKSGESGKLFGAITNKEISSALNEQANINIDKKKISLKRDIKAIGEFSADIKLHSKVNVSLKIKVNSA